jgi:hypothetical protein
MTTFSLAQKEFFDAFDLAEAEQARIENERVKLRTQFLAREEELSKESKMWADKVLALRKADAAFLVSQHCGGCARVHSNRNPPLHANTGHGIKEKIDRYLPVATRIFIAGSCLATSLPQESSATHAPDKAP